MRSWFPIIISVKQNAAVLKTNVSNFDRLGRKARDWKKGKLHSNFTMDMHDLTSCVKSRLAKKNATKKIIPMVQFIYGTELFAIVSFDIPK